MNFYKNRNFGTEHLDYYDKINDWWADTYLDIGCANWNGINFVKENIGKKKVYGIDIYKSNPKTIVCNVNSQKIPLKSEAIDIISSFEVIEHINNTKHFIEEIYRVLHKEGKLYISTPNLAWWGNRLLLLFGYQPANTEIDFNHSMYGKPKLFKDNIGSGHIHVFTDKAMKEFLSANGFWIERRYKNTAKYEGNPLISIIDKIISSIIPNSAVGYMYVCKKIV